MESVITFNFVSWFNFLSFENKKKWLRVIRLTSTIIGYPQTQRFDLYNFAVKRKAASIVTDPSHSLYYFFQLLSSDCRLEILLPEGRLIVIILSLLQFLLY